MSTHNRRSSVTPTPTIVVRANANDGELIKQWIVYLIGQQVDGPLSAYSLPDPSSSSMFGALTSSVSPSRSGRSPSMAGGNSQPIPVSKNISSEVVRPLRLVGQDLAELVRDLSIKEAQEKNLTRRARQGEVIYEDTAAGRSPSRTLQREPTVDVEDLDAFLSADAPNKNNAPTPTSSAVATTSGANKSPPTIDKSAVDVVCTNISKESSVLLQDPSSQQASSSGTSVSGGGGRGGNKKREAGRSEADAYQHAQLTLDSSRKSLAAALDKFISLHNDRLAQVFFQGGAVGPEVSDVNKTLLAAKTREELQGLIEAYAAESSKTAREDGTAFAKARDDLVALLEETNTSITECEALSLRGALAEEMARIEDRLRQAARRGATAVKRSQHRLDEIRPVLDAAMPLEDDSSLPSFTSAVPGGGDSPSTLAATREPREVLSSLNNAMKTQVEPFAQRTRDVFMQRVASVEERQDDVCPGESVVAYQQTRRQHLLQSTEDLKAVTGVIQRQLGTLRSVFESRDRPAAQAEHDRWLAYSKSLESIRSELLRNLEARVRYDEETAGMRSAQREKLPPPPARYVVRLPDTPSDPRPDNARGGLHNLPRTWRERYARMPAAALLCAQPKELRTPEQKAEEERRARLEGEAESEMNEGHHPYATIAVDMVPESEKLRHELRVTLNKKKAREQCHAAIERQLVALVAAEASREANESAPLSPNSAAASIKAPLPPPAVNYAASEAARKALFEVLRKYS